MMPYQALERPSPALGILVAIARQAGFAAHGTYPGFRFAEKIGLANYQLLEGSYQSLLGEWSFSDAAFPDVPSTLDAADDPAAYYHLLLASLPAAPGPVTLDAGASGPLLTATQPAA